MFGNDEGMERGISISKRGVKGDFLEMLGG